MPGKTCLMAMNGATSITLTRSSNFSVGKLSMGETCCRPALLTRMSMRPKRSAATSSALVSCASLVTSQSTPIASRPPFAMPSAAARTASSLTSESATLAPSSASACAIASPMPLAAPVTKATLSFTRSDMATLPLSPALPPRRGGRGTKPFDLDSRPLERKLLRERDRLADEPAPEGEHAHHEHDPRDDGHPRPEAGQVVLQDEHDEGADGGAHHGPHPAEERHQHDLAGHVPVHVGERLGLEHHRLERSGEPRERGRDDEGEQLVPVDVVPERQRARFVLPDRAEHVPERRVDGSVDEPEAEEEDGVGEVVHRVLAVEGDEPEELPPRHALQAVVAAREVHLDGAEVDDLRQAERDHREVDPGAPDGEPADGEPEDRRHRRPEEDAELRREPPHLERVAGHVPGRAQERRVAEGEEPGVAEQQVERAGEERHAEHVHDEHRVHEVRQDQPGHRHPGEGEAHAPGRPADARARAEGDAHRYLPKSPAGRSSSTMAMTKKTTTDE